MHIIVICQCRAHIAHSLTDNYFVVSSTVGNVGLCNPADIIGLWLECMACTLGDMHTCIHVHACTHTLFAIIILKINGIILSPFIPLL